MGSIRMILKRLFENYKQELSPEEALNLILSKGMPYLNEVDGKLLFSGRNNSPKIFKADYRTNRMPLTTSMSVQNKLDDAMKKLGIEALRSNSIFTTSNVNTANSYGKPYVIFPLGDINYHFTNVSDLYNYMNIRMKKIEYNIFELADFYNIEMSVDTIKKLMEFIGDMLIYVADYADKEGISIDEAISYLYNNRDKVSDAYWNYILDDSDYDDLGKIFNSSVFPYDYVLSKKINIQNNTNIESAIKSGNEILINSSEGYIAIKAEPFFIYCYDKLRETIKLDRDHLQKLSTSCYAFIYLPEILHQTPNTIKIFLDSLKEIDKFGSGVITLFSKNFPRLVDHAGIGLMLSSERFLANTNEITGPLAYYIDTHPNKKQIYEDVKNIIANKELSKTTIVELNQIMPELNLGDEE